MPALPLPAQIAAATNIRPTHLSAHPEVPESDALPAIGRDDGGRHLTGRQGGEGPEAYDSLTEIVAASACSVGFDESNT